MIKFQIRVLLAAKIFKLLLKINNWYLLALFDTKDIMLSLHTCNDERTTTCSECLDKSSVSCKTKAL